MQQKKKRPIDYYNLFIIGIVWIGAGIPLKNYALSVVGGILGLALGYLATFAAQTFLDAEVTTAAVILSFTFS